jgi:hypothetical protein
MPAEHSQQGRVGLEQKLVEISIRPPARAKDEIAFQVRGCDQIARQLVAVSYQGVPATRSI